MLLVLLLAALLHAPAAPGATGFAAASAARTDTASARLSDDELLERVQRRTFAYFWEFADPASGMARERSNVTREYGHEVAATGGTGFGVMATTVAVERGWVTRAQAVDRLLRLTAFLAKADRFHGAFPHWMNGATGRVIPFDRLDDGGDVVETAYLFEGLLTARQYFDRAEPGETELRRRIDTLWHGVEWDAFVRPGRNTLWWTWSPRHGFADGGEVSGWNEALVTYVLAAGSPDHAIDTLTYHHGWARDGAIRNGNDFAGITLPLGPPEGGPLFFEHYSFMGIDPRGLTDRYADYWLQALNHTLINREHCVSDPAGFAGYGENAWGLTASDDPGGYRAHSPTEDDGVLAPTAALSAFPYAPEFAMQALRHFHDDLGGTLFGPYGFADAFDPGTGWVAPSCIAIDEGPIIVMIENYRTGLPWRLFMSCPEVQAGLRKLGFSSPWLR